MGIIFDFEVEAEGSTGWSGSFTLLELSYQVDNLLQGKDTIRVSRKFRSAAFPLGSSELS